MSKIVTLDDGEQIPMRDDDVQDNIDLTPKMVTVDNLVYATVSRYAMIVKNTMQKDSQINKLKLPRMIIDPETKTKYVVIGVAANAFDNVNIDHVLLPSSIKSLDVNSFKPNTVLVFKTSLDSLTNIVLTNSSDTMQGQMMSTAGPGSPMVAAAPLNEFKIKGDSNGLVVNKQMSLLTGFPDKVGKFNFDIVSEGAERLLFRFLLVVQRTRETSVRHGRRMRTTLFNVLSVLLLIAVVYMLYKAFSKK